MNDAYDNPPEKKIAGKMFIVMWIIFIALLSYLFNIILDKQSNPNQNLSSIQLQSGIIEIVLQRNRYGHYVTDGKINNQEVVFMLDTGATDVSIPRHIAEDLMLKQGHAMIYGTANGDITVYATQLKNISIDQIKLDNIKATINPNTDESVVLLGMSFLKHLEFTQRGDSLILRQYPEQL
ncbi:MAG: TIGR02281 family clan AA aspartic protease [Gammaproteobacteria bacterium]|nr:TIGR02281 family clan AA aspartic protease [Gammaproteobacteria bacterium]